MSLLIQKTSRLASFPRGLHLNDDHREVMRTS
jgi:hypothetical protein